MRSAILAYNIETGHRRDMAQRGVQSIALAMDICFVRRHAAIEAMSVIDGFKTSWQDDRHARRVTTVHTGTRNRVWQRLLCLGTIAVIRLVLRHRVVRDRRLSLNLLPWYKSILGWRRGCPFTSAEIASPTTAVGPAAVACIVSCSITIRMLNPTPRDQGVGRLSDA